MRVEKFDFDTSAIKIAERPSIPRDSAKLLHLQNSKISDRKVSMLPDLLQEGDVLVLNDTKVIPARLFGKIGDSNIEFLLNSKQTDFVWTALANPRKKISTGDIVSFGDGFFAVVLDNNKNKLISLKFNCKDKKFEQLLEVYGRTPIPPYINRNDDQKDKWDYQTIYSRVSGSIAAPTAGLHFTSGLLDRLRKKGIEIVFITLHVGIGTFQPVRVEHTENHEMHEEKFSISAISANRLSKAKKEGRRIISVGTTVLRALESAAEDNKSIKPVSSSTKLFIVPGYKFKVVDLLFTNFHLPKSTLIILVSAFIGIERMKEIYKHAVENGYRFYSYGDACLIEKNNGK